MDHGSILLTGATGYIGGRLRQLFEREERPLRCLTRRPDNLRRRVAPATEVIQGDVLDAESLPAAFEGCSTAYYLVHSMGDASDFVERERRAAENFARAAKQAGVERVIYLGGLGGDERLSSHLASRQETGEILRRLGPPTIELRASIVIGSGSLSFEMIRALVDRLPVMVTPRWVRSVAQPIAIEDVLAYLVEAERIELPPGGAVYEIGGTDRASYQTIMGEYARQRGLRRFMIPVPLLTPRLSGLWLGLVTPLYARVGRKLLESLRHDTVVRDRRALEDFSVRPRGLGEAIQRALANEDADFAATRWSDALSSHGGPKSWGGVRFGSRLVDSRTAAVDVPPARAFDPIARIGGRTGWYYGDWLWRVRGWLDLLVGGPGMRRGRRDPVSTAQGETLDFWRVEAFEPPRLLRLEAEMKVPGRAWLQFEVDEKPGGGSTIRQTAIFDPVGWLGVAYWYALYPLHELIFAGMLRQIARRATVAKATPSWPSAKPSSAR